MAAALPLDKSQREVFEVSWSRGGRDRDDADLERAELIRIYRSTGSDPRGSRNHVGRITADKQVWLETQLARARADASLFETPSGEIVAGISTFIGGAIPGAGFLLGRFLLGGAMNGFAALAVTFVLCAAFLFVIGAARSFFTGKNGVRSGLEMLIVGSVVAALAYGIGVLFRA